MEEERDHLPIFWAIVGLFFATVMVAISGVAYYGQEIFRRWRRWPLWITGAITVAFTLPFILTYHAVYVFGYCVPRNIWQTATERWRRYEPVDLADAPREIWRGGLVVVTLTIMTYAAAIQWWQEGSGEQIPTD